MGLYLFEITGPRGHHSTRMGMNPVCRSSISSTGVRSFGLFSHAQPCQFCDEEYQYLNQYLDIVY